MTRKFKRVEKSKKQGAMYIIVWAVCIALCVPMVYPFKQVPSTINIGTNLCIAVDPFFIDSVF